MSDRRASRRRVLRAGTAGIVGAATAAAGCADLLDGDDDESDDGPDDGEVSLAEPVPEIEYVMPTEEADPRRHELSSMVADNFERVGLAVGRRPVDRETHTSILLVEHTFDVAVCWGESAPERIDPDSFLVDFHHGDTTEAGMRNAPGYDNAEFDEVAEAQRRTVDRAERRDLVYECQELLARDQPRCYVVNEDDVHPYAAERFEDVVPMMGEGLNSFWTMVEGAPADGADALRFGHQEEIDSLNPIQDVPTAARQWVRLLYDRLYRIGVDGSPRPWAAVGDPEFEDDGETVTVEVRNDLTFHDGEPVTAEDVGWSFEYFGDHSVTYSERLERVEEIDVTGDREVTFHLEEPFAPFVATVLAEVSIFPEHVWRGVDDPLEEGDEDYVGGGPFRFEAFDPGGELRLRAFEDHFDPPNVDRIVRVQRDNVAALVALLEDGEVDVVGATPSPDTRDRLADDPGIEQELARTIAFVGLSYNMRREVTADVSLRRAMSRCVPRETIVEDVLDGVGTPAYSPIAAVNEFWHNPDVERLSFDLDAAERELADAGYGWDDDGRLHYTEAHEPRTFLDDGEAS